MEPLIVAKLAIHMTLAEVYQNGLSITRYFHNPCTEYDIKELSAYRISKISGIDRTTIIKWCHKGKVKFRLTKGIHLVNLLSFVNYAMYNYRYGIMNSRSGKWWDKEESMNPIERTHSAIRAHRCRMRKLK